jgi:hypothetical protein
VDFVIAGFGVGAVLLLLGLAARDVGPRLSAKSSAALRDPSTSSPASNPWRLVPLAGPTIMIGGAAVIVATFMGIFFQLGDQTAGRLVFFTSLGAVLFVAIRMPFLARAQPEMAEKVVKPEKPAKQPRAAKVKEPIPEEPRRTPPPRRRQPKLFASSPPISTNGVSENSDGKRRPSPEPQIHADVVEAEAEVPAVGSWGFPDWPNIFESDEPIQEGLLERLLADDPNWHQDHEQPVGEDKVIDEAIKIDEVGDPASTSESALPGRPGI